MPFISVVPAIRTPFGVDSFDYEVHHDSTLAVGDVTIVPFRKRNLPALVISKSPTSDFAGRARAVSDEQLLRLGPASASLLAETARRTYSSMPTVLAAWLRHVPVRATRVGGAVSVKRADGGGSTRRIYTASRIQTVIEQARSAKSCVLVLTPWQHRAEMLAKTLSTKALHADMADGSAWSAVSSFVGQPSSILVATRIGGWLCSVADTVIVDEPENDDLKQDELSPRMDTRWLVSEASRLRPELKTIFVATTPPISPSLSPQEAPTIDVALTTEQWQRGSKTPINGLSPNAIEQLEAALEEKRSVIILHPVHGDRSRLHCRDCGWTMKCSNCDFQMTAELTIARCHRCGQTEQLPEVCPSCGGADLTAARAGKDRVAAQVAQHYGDRVQVADLPEWHRLSLSKGALVIVTDVSLIGGYVEDIRRRERLVISWRRLAASVLQIEGSLYAMGSEQALSDARRWLDSAGLIATWAEEWKERQAFAYPPAKRRFKLILEGDVTEGEKALEVTKQILGSEWTIEGPYPVVFRAKTRKIRTILHLLPPERLTGPEELYRLLEPLAKVGIIDLDPIAFFS